MTNVEALWEVLPHARFLNRLASSSRVILFDKRGVGLSDRVPESQLPSLETRMDDLRAAMDAAASERAVVFESPRAVRWRCSSPRIRNERAFLLLGTVADFTSGLDAGERAHRARPHRETLGTEEYAAPVLRGASPSLADDERMVTRLALYTRRAARLAAGGDRAERRTT